MLTEKQIQRRIDQLDYEIGMTRNQDALSESEKDAIIRFASIERATLEHVLGGSTEEIGDKCIVVRWKDLFNPNILSTEEYDIFRHCLYRISEYRKKEGERDEVIE